MSHDPQHTIVPVRTYVIVWATLLLCTFLTVLAAGQDFGAANSPIALGIAVFKASLVVFFFMGLRYNSPLTKLAASAGLIWLMIFFGLTLNDYLTRTWIGFPGR
jgi:cytochrome c oxidase subunit 4